MNGESPTSPPGKNPPDSPFPAGMVSPSPAELAADDAAAPPSATLTVQQLYHQGPLPSAIELRRYGEIDPAFPDRIMRMAESDLAHQHDLGRRMAADRRTGLWLGWSLTMALMAIGAFLLWQEKDVGGWAALAGALAFVVVPMVIGKRHGGREQS